MLPYKVYATIQLGPITLYTWGILVGIGFLAGWLVAVWQAKKRNIDTDKITTISIWIILSAILGARILFILENFSLFQGRLLDIFKIWQGGFSYYGGLAGGISALIISTKKYKLNLRRVLDVFGLSLPLGIAIGRMGCFLVNDHLGEETFLPWAIKHPDESLRHPVALYLSASALLCFFFLFIIKKRLKYDGLIACSFLLWYSFSRFFLDFAREHTEGLSFADPHYMGFTLSQFISVGLFILASYFTIRIIKTHSVREGSSPSSGGI